MLSVFLPTGLKHVSRIFNSIYGSDFQGSVGYHKKRRRTLAQKREAVYIYICISKCNHMVERQASTNMCMCVMSVFSILLLLLMFCFLIFVSFLFVEGSVHKECLIN